MANEKKATVNFRLDEKSLDAIKKANANIEEACKLLKLNLETFRDVLKGSFKSI